MTEQTKTPTPDAALGLDGAGMGSHNGVGNPRQTRLDTEVHATIQAPARLRALAGEMERLTREAREAHALTAAAYEAGVTLGEELSAERTARERAEAALRRYGQHLDYCRRVPVLSTGCDCGLDAALAGEGRADG